MAKLFISYRRSDSQDVTGRIRDELATRFGSKNVFYDVVSVQAAVDYRTIEEETILRSDVVLVIIGRKWVEHATEGGDWRPETEDQVRYEIATALRHNVKIMPVLVAGAAMPEADQLPKDIREIVYLNAPSVRSDPDFHNDLEKLWRELVRLNVGGLPGPSSDPNAEFAGLPTPAVEYGWDVDSRMAFERQFLDTMNECLAAERPFYTYTQLPAFVSRDWPTQIARQKRVFEANPPVLAEIEALMRARYTTWDRLEQGPGVFVIADKAQHKSYFSGTNWTTLDLSVAEIRAQAARLSQLLDSHDGFHMGLSEIPIGETFFCGSPTSVVTYNNVPPTVHGPTRGVRGACYRDRETVDTYLSDFQTSWAELPAKNKDKGAVREWLKQFNRD